MPKPTVAALKREGIQVPRISVGLLTLHEIMSSVNFSRKQLQQFSQVYLICLLQLTMNVARVRELKEGFWLPKQKDAGRAYITVSCVSRDRSCHFVKPCQDEKDALHISKIFPYSLRFPAVLCPFKGCCFP